MTVAPFTDDEVASLNEFQAAGVMHPFTCGNEQCRTVLVAEWNGWHCPKCGYRQDWAHEFMVDGTWRKTPPVSAGGQTVGKAEKVFWCLALGLVAALVAAAAMGWLTEPPKPQAATLALEADPNAPPAGAEAVVQMPASGIRVIDGDTVELLHDGERVTVRLVGIDAPERDQAYGREATKRLEKFFAGATASDVQQTLAKERPDKYGRRLAYLDFRGDDAGLAMLASGLAWTYPPDKPAKTFPGLIYPNMEKSNRESKEGLWADPNPVPPWEWRKRKAKAPGAKP